MNAETLVLFKPFSVSYLTITTGIHYSSYLFHQFRHSYLVTAVVNFKLFTLNLYLLIIDGSVKYGF